MRVYDKIEYKKYVGNLSGEYKDCYEKIEGFTKISFCGNEKEEEKCIYQILGEIISAQKSFKPLSMVIGSNLRDYCYKYINANQPPNAKKIKFIQTSAIYISFVLILMLIKGIRMYSSDFASNLSFGILEIIVLAYATVWSVLRTIISNVSIRKNKWIKNLDIYLNIIFIILVIPAITLNDSIIKFGVNIPLIAFLAIVLLVVLVLVYTTKMKNTKKTEMDK